LQHSLAERFRKYSKDHPRFKAQSAAVNFLKKPKAECDAVGLTKPKSLVQAMRRLSK